MTTTLPQVTSAMRSSFTTVARQAAREPGFMQRPATTKCDGAGFFALTLLSNPINQYI